MKNTSVIFLLILLLSCKKEEPAKPPPPPPPRPNTMSATLNGMVWSVKNNNTADADISFTDYRGTPKQYVISGRTISEYNRHSIYIGFTYFTGTRNFETFSTCYAAYDDSTGTGHFAKTGTINISVIDTSHAKSPLIDKLKATFSFTTSTVLKKYVVENGVIDFEAR